MVKSRWTAMYCMVLSRTVPTKLDGHDCLALYAKTLHISFTKTKMSKPVPAWAQSEEELECPAQNPDLNLTVPHQFLIPLMLLVEWAQIPRVKLQHQVEIAVNFGTSFQIHSSAYNNFKFRRCSHFKRNIVWIQSKNPFGRFFHPHRLWRSCIKRCVCYNRSCGCPSCEDVD